MNSSTRDTDTARRVTRLLSCCTFFPVCSFFPHSAVARLLSSRTPRTQEWSVLREMAAADSGAGLVGWPRHLRPAQIAFEAHLADLVSDAWMVAHPGRHARAPGVPVCATKENRQCGVPAAAVDKFMGLLYQSGYLLAGSWPNTRWAHCREVLVAQPDRCVHRSDPAD